MRIERDVLLEMYRTMLSIRFFEDRVSKEFAAGNIPGALHLYIGEEAVATGVCANLQKTDLITSTHRGHGHVIAKGGKTDRMLAELLGKRTGYCNGKGGSMHIADPEIGILGANGIVGGGIPIAGGAALSAQIRESGQVVVCFLGDGACNRGTFHEGINMAACWNLPVIYVIENNLYAQKTRITDTARLTNLADRAAAYGLPDVTVDGNDVVAVYEAIHEAVTRARQGHGPTLVECKTYRWHGHYEGDAQTYKSKEEIESWRKRDPIPTFREKLVKEGSFTLAELEKIDREVSDEIEAAVKYARASPYPAPEETLEDVFA